MGASEDTELVRRQRARTLNTELAQGQTVLCTIWRQLSLVQGGTAAQLQCRSRGREVASATLSDPCTAGLSC